MQIVFIFVALMSRFFSGGGGGGLTQPGSRDLAAQCSCPTISSELIDGFVLF